MLEDTFDAFVVNFCIREDNKEVVHVNDKPSFSYHVVEGVIHESLECGWGVGKVKEHDSWFKKALMDDKGSFPLVAIFYADIVVSPADVKLSEKFGVFELIDEIRDKGKRVGVTDCMFIQVAIVLAGMKSSIFFVMKKREMLGWSSRDRSSHSRGSPEESLPWLFVCWRSEGTPF